MRVVGAVLICPLLWWWWFSLSFSVLLCLCGVVPVRMCLVSLPTLSRAIRCRVRWRRGGARRLGATVRQRTRLRVRIGQRRGAAVAAPAYVRPDPCHCRSAGGRSWWGQALACGPPSPVWRPTTSPAAQPPTPHRRAGGLLFDNAHRYRRICGGTAGDGMWLDLRLCRDVPGDPRVSRKNRLDKATDSSSPSPSTLLLRPQIVRLLRSALAPVSKPGEGSAPCRKACYK